MSEQLDKMYQKVILDEAKNAFHFENKKSLKLQKRAYNPICGDRFDLFLDIKSEVIVNIFFHGFGCTLSKASTSIMIQQLIGKSTNEALQSINDFLEALSQKKKELPGKLHVFQNIDNFKGRVDCIVLSWTALKNYLEKP